MPDNTVRPDGSKVKRYRLERGWSQDDLASHAILAKRTIENIEASRPTYAGTLARLAKPLGVEPKDLLALDQMTPSDHDGQAPTEAPEGLPLSTMVPIDIVIRGKLSDFTEEKQRQLFERFKQILDICGDIHLINIREGSVVVTLLLTPEQAARLILAVEKGQLADLGVIDAYSNETDKESEEVGDPSQKTDWSLSPWYSLPSTQSSTSWHKAIPGYEIEAMLGQGGMGVVYKARELSGNRTVALKSIEMGVDLRSGILRLTRDVEGDPRSTPYADLRITPHPGGVDLPLKQALKREARASEGLQHPNIAGIFGIVRDQAGSPYLVMEYAEGGSLAQKLASSPLPFREAAQLVETLAWATNYAHRQGILHRDIKPANILLTADGTPKLSDFGLARQLTRGTETPVGESGTLTGTLAYMAPEQVGGKTEEIGPAADIYALGATLYEMLTGRPPFQAGSAPATLLEVMTNDPVPPSRLRPEVPRELEAICLKCLQKDPRKRYGSAELLAEDLRHFLLAKAASPPSIAARESIWNRMVNWLKRVFGKSP